MKRLIIAALCLPLVVLACQNEQVEPEVIDPCDATNYLFTTDIQPIIETNCVSASCHGGMNNLPDYSTYQGVYADRFMLRSGIKMGLENITNGRAELTRAEQNMILCWIEKGAPE